MLRRRLLFCLPIRSTGFFPRSYAAQAAEPTELLQQQKKGLQKENSDVEQMKHIAAFPSVFYIVPVRFF